jgi:hypothetical protein
MGVVCVATRSCLTVALIRGGADGLIDETPLTSVGASSGVGPRSSQVTYDLPGSNTPV